MSMPADSKTAAAPALKGIVNERESQLRLVTSVRLRWMAVLGQLATVALIRLIYGFPFNIGSCLILIAMSAWLNVFLSIRYPARHRLSTPVAFGLLVRSEEHTSELQSPNLISYAVFCLKKIFFNDTATTEIYTLSLHDALPIFGVA